jgi:hypothetical protein
LDLPLTWILEVEGALQVPHDDSIVRPLARRRWIKSWRGVHEHEYKKTKQKNKEPEGVEIGNCEFTVVSGKVAADKHAGTNFRRSNKTKAVTLRLYFD